VADEEDSPPGAETPETETAPRPEPAEAATRTASAEDAPPAAARRPEIEIPPRPVAPPPRRYVQLGLVGCVVLFSVVVHPLNALSCVIPWAAIIAILLVGTRKRELPAATVRIGAEGLRTIAPGIRTFTPWSEVVRLLDGGGSLTAVLKSGAQIAIDLASQPDLRAILTLAPADVAYERAAPAPAPGMKQSHKTLLLWLLLIVMMIAIWRLANDP
jgi:hypothetical protein